VLSARQNALADSFGVDAFKAVVGDAYKAVERRLLTTIHLRFGIAGWNDQHCCCRHHESTGVGALLFALLMFIGAAISFSVAIIALHLWFASRFILRLMEGKWFRAIGWLVLLLILFYIDGTILNTLS
jgi:hypothetical protein